jgi:MFS family permease
LEIESTSKRSAILALYAMNFLTSSGFGAFGVILPLYMRDSGVSFVGLGLAFGAFGIVMGATGMFFGAHSDVIGRKPYLVLSLILRAVVTFFYTQATSTVSFIVLNALSGLSTSLSAAIVPALMTDLTKDSERGRRFGGMGGFGWMGTGLGYFLGGALSQIFGYSWSFIFLTILILVSCFLILLFIPSYRLPTKERFNLGLVKQLSPNLKIWLIITFISSLVMGPVEVMVIPLYSVAPGPLGIDKIVFGSFMAISYILTSSTQFIGGSMADKYGRRKLASLFRLSSAPFIMVQPLFPYFTYFASMYIFEGVGEGLSQPCNSAMIASSVRTEHRGFDYSIVNLSGNVGGTIGFLIIGSTLDTIGFTYPFAIRALAYVFMAILIYAKLKD